MRVLLRTFGCRANQYDAEQVRALVEAAGGTVLDGSEVRSAAADVAVLTSCAVTAEAEADLRQAVRRIARDRPDTRVIVTGCAASRSPAAIAALPGVTAVVPGADLAATAAALGLAAPVAPARRHATARATLRVQEGCDEHCTFCATTLARGAHRSRDLAVLVDEATALAEHHPEIVLTGIHVGSWGRERRQPLGVLVRTLVERVPRVRFRLASVEATEVDGALAELLRDGGGRVCPYLHAPLQSGSDAVLRRMGRHWYTARAYAEAIDRLTAGRAVFGLGADVMTGFPGETDADHAETLAIVRALPFTHLHVFPYSVRPGTAAVRLPDPVPASVTRARAAELRALADAKAAAYARSRIGGPADVVIVGPDAGAEPHSGMPVRGTPSSSARDAAASPPLRAGLTEDYLHVRLPSTAPRGAVVRLELTGEMVATRTRHAEAALA